MEGEHGAAAAAGAKRERASVPGPSPPACLRPPTPSLPSCGGLACALPQIPLTAYGHTGELEGGAGFEYTIWGVACSEAEINVLTGDVNRWAETSWSCGAATACMAVLVGCRPHAAAPCAPLCLAISSLTPSLLPCPAPRPQASAISCAPTSCRTVGALSTLP